jgi:hypothetical protein
MKRHRLEDVLEKRVNVIIRDAVEGDKVNCGMLLGTKG